MSKFLPPHTDTGRDKAIDMLTLQLGASSMRPLASLKSYSRTIRKHPEKQLVKLAASMREFGYLVPALVNADGVIIAGEARVAAARRIGLTAIPVIEVSHLSPAQVRAFRIADNKLGDLSTFDTRELAIEMEAILSADISVESLGFETAEVDLMMSLGDEPEADPADAIPALPDQPVTRSGDRWNLGDHRLLCASSLEETSWAALMGGELAAMAFTDAPFNVPVNGHVSGSGKFSEFSMASGEMSETEFIEFNRIYLTRMAAHLSDGAILFACMDWKHLFEILTAVRSVGLSLINLCVWNKSNGGQGSFYRSKHELVLVLKKGRERHINNIQLGATGRYRCNVWDYAGANSFGRSRTADLNDHPTVKPAALVADAIRDVSHNQQIVVDAFMGSGTTIIAAERTRRRAYGIEIEPGYVDVAIRRWSELTGSEVILQATGETFAQVRARRYAEASALTAAATVAAAEIVARPRQRRVA